MKELTKSLTSFSWAMSLFGAKQLINMMDPAKATSAFQSVTDATESHLDAGLRAAFQTGDRLQRSMVDTAFSLMTVGGSLDPTTWVGAARQAAGQASRVVQKAAAHNQAGSAETGWGPMEVDL